MSRVADTGLKVKNVAPDQVKLVSAALHQWFEETARWSAEAEELVVSDGKLCGLGYYFDDRDRSG